MSAIMSLCLLLLTTQVVADKETPRVGFDGYCPVNAVENRQYTQGDRQISQVYDKAIYYFSSDDAKKKFNAKPAKYVPALGGYCTVCYVRTKKMILGTVTYGVRYEDRLYLFPNERTRKQFWTDEKLYASCDLALSGLCPVAKSNGREVKGNKEIAEVHNGLVYRFASDDARQKFNSSRNAYQVKRVD